MEAVQRKSCALPIADPEWCGASQGDVGVCGHIKNEENNSLCM
jgi:hypothetical protein